jgi:hypothetical protein
LGGCALVVQQVGEAVGLFVDLRKQAHGDFPWGEL